MNRKLYLTSLIATALVSSAACTPKAKQVSQVSHQAGQVAVGRHPSYWAEAPRADHENFVRKALSAQDAEAGKNVKFYWDHPMQARLQAWVNAMDSAARKTIWGQKYMAATPRPMVVLLDLESPNAFMAGAIFQYPVNGLLKGETATVQKSDAVYSDGVSVLESSLFAMAGVKPIPAARPELISDVIDRQREVRKKLKRPCLPLNTGAGKMSFEGTCESLSKESTLEFASYVSKQSTNYVNIHMGLLRMMPEAEVVATIAHELGHYYRAHSTDENTLSDGFFFEENLYRGGTRPVPSTNTGAEEKGRKALQAAKATTLIPEGLPNSAMEAYYLSGFLTDRIIPTLFFSQITDEEHRALFGENPIVTVAQVMDVKCRAVHKPIADCDTFKTAALDPAFVKAAKRRAFALADRALYDNVERAFLRFAHEIKLDRWNLTSPLQGDAVGLSLLFPHKTQEGETLTEITENTAFEKIKNINETMPLDDFMRLVSHAVTQRRSEDFKVVESFIAKGYGWYTYEQEADEIGAELVASVGLQPSKMKQALMSLFGYIYGKGVVKPGIDYPTCKSLDQNEFGLRTGNPTPVKLADWTEPHHDLCYRAFNITRDLIAHNYQLGNPPAVQGTWESAIATLPSPTTPPSATQISAHSGLVP